MKNILLILLFVSTYAFSQQYTMNFDNMEGTKWEIAFIQDNGLKTKAETIVFGNKRLDEKD